MPPSAARHAPDPFGTPRGAAVRDEVVAFLREWLPDEARRAYREMMEEHPEGWMRDPHFGGGVIVRHALRGNGLDERALGIPDLDAVWPDLLRRAVLGDPA
jgi:hypothetical protein